jgi:hypothetical protein
MGRHSALLKQVFWDVTLFSLIVINVSHFYPEEGWKMFIRNVGNHLPGYMESHARRLQCYYPLP